MAVNASLNQYDQDRTVDLQLYSDEPRVRVTDNPPRSDREPDAYISFFWNDEKIESQGEYELLGVEILNIGKLSDGDIELIENLNPPRIDIPEVGLHDVTVGFVLRRARAKWLTHTSPITTP